MKPLTSLTLLEISGLFLCSLALFTAGLGGQEIISFDSRFYLFAQEMGRNGITWFPTTYGHPYPDYPVTSTLLIYFFSWAFGGLNKGIAVLPSAIAAAITVVMTYLIGALENKRLGLCAVFFLLFTVTFLKSARSISLDMYSVMITTCCFYFIYAADKWHKPQWARWIYVFLLLGFAFRGPIGLVVPTGVIGMYYLLNREWKKLVIMGMSALALLSVATLVLGVLAYHVGGDSFLRAVFRMQVLGRMETSFLPPYFYWMDGLSDYALSFPLAILAALGALYYACKSRPHSSSLHFLLQLTGWWLVVMVGMSLPGDKKIRYVLPMVPAAALMAAYCFTAVFPANYFLRCRQIVLALCLFFPLIGMGAVLGVSHYLQRHDMNAGIHSVSLLLSLTCLQVVSAMVATVYAKRSSVRDTIILLIATCSFIIAYVAVVEPLELHIDQTRAFVQQIEKQRIVAGAQLVFYKERPDSLPIKYLINMPMPQRVSFVRDPQALLAYTQPAFFVASQTYFEELAPAIAAQFQVVANNKVGHVPVVVFKRGG